MQRKHFSRAKIQRLLLYAITVTFTISTLGQDASAFDKSYAAGNDIEFYEPCPTDPDVDADSTFTPSEYIKNGKIPKEGLVVGATVFGGKQQGGKWVANWADNGGNDMGNANNHLTGTTSFAELTMSGKLGTALGNIENGSKIEITYGGKKIIAEKGDIGTGGDDISGSAPAPGKVLMPKDKSKQKKPEVDTTGEHVTAGRGVDLWWETANLLGVNDGTTIITIHAVKKDTPVTPVSGKAAPDKDSTENTSTEGGVCCNTSQQTGDGTLIGDTNKEQIWNFLVGNDGNLTMQDALSPEQAAGLMGNIQVESSFNPKAENAIGAFGIVQWLDNRRTRLEAAAKDAGVPPTDLKLQLKFLVQESKARRVAGKAASKYGNAGKSEWITLKQQSSIEKAADFWNLSFEVSGVSSTPRANNGKKILTEMTKKFPVGGGVTAGGPAGSESKQVIFLDPGHGGNISDYTDKQSGLITNETMNDHHESEDVLEVANRVKTALEEKGYKVEMARTKNYPDGKASDPRSKRVATFRERADDAAKANASIGISIHTTPDDKGKDINQAWSQKVGTFRESRNGSNHTEFKKKYSDTADKSQDYARAIAKARTEAEGHEVTLDSNHTQQAASFGRGGNIKSPGNIPLVALFSPTVPWVYNEITQDRGKNGLSEKLKKAYAEGIVNGVVEALPPVASGCDSSADASGLTGYIMKYAWPEPHPAPYTKKKPEYEAAVKKASSEGRYVGGLAYPGVDCGGFVTTLLVDSGFEPKYNYGGKMSKGAGTTVAQEAWAKKNWETIGSGRDIKIGTDLSDKKVLRPGDVALYNGPGNVGHTFVYSGKIPGFKTPTNVASASVSFNGTGWRAPMAGTEDPKLAKWTWYRKK